MSRNGSGSYSLPVNSWNPAINSVPATASDWQALINDVAQALTQSLSRDGQTVLTGNLQMGGNKLTGMSAGAASGESLRFEQLFSQGQPIDLASAATTDIGAQLTTVLNITGTTTITSFGTNYNGPRFLRFDGSLILTHSATLVLPGGANITTAAGDSAIVVPLGTPAAGWRVVAYQLASNVPGAIADGSITPAKLSTGGPFWNTSGSFGVGSVSPATKLFVVDSTKVATTPLANTIASFRSNASNADATFQISDNTSYSVSFGLMGGTSGAFGFATSGVERLRIAADGSQSSVIPGGSTLLPDFKCRAWAKFSGTATGTNAPTAGGNVTSVTRNSAGGYTVNLATAMPDANYAIVATALAGGRPVWTRLLGTPTSSSFNLLTENMGAGGVTYTTEDAISVYVSVFR